MAGLGIWSLTGAALIILLLPRSECVQGVELWRRIWGVEEGIISLNYHTTPGLPENPKRIKTGPQMWVAGLLHTDLGRHTTTREEWWEDLGWSAWKRSGDPGLIYKSLPGCQKEAESCAAFKGNEGIRVEAIRDRFHPEIKKSKKSSPAMGTLP